MRTLLAAVGSVNDPRTWSGTPFHLLAAARPTGVIDEGLDLATDTAAWTVRRLMWNGVAVLRGGGHGGYQFTDAFLRRLWRPIRDRLPGSHVINCTQVFPSDVATDPRVRRSYFLDQTLSQLFDDYGVRATIRADVAADALEREADGYRSAHAIVVHSAWARRAVLAVGGIDAERVHVVVPGANLDAAALGRWAAAHRPSPRRAGEPLRLVFVGRHPVRKGLDRLLAAVGLARAGGVDVRLDVIGTRPQEVAPDLRGVGGTTWHGPIDKARDPGRFMAVVGGAHVGCLLSRAEAGGIGLREYHALGLAVLGPDVGGSPDHVLHEAAVLVRPEASEAEVAALLSGLAADHERVDAMREVSWRRRDEVSWGHAVAGLAPLLH